MLTKFYFCPSTLRRLRRGPLGEHIDAFAEWLSQQGYTGEFLRYKIRWVSYLSYWLYQHGLCTEDLNEARVRKFLEERGSQSDRVRGNMATFRYLLCWLRDNGVLAPARLPKDDSMQGRLERNFTLYLTRERGLTQATAKKYLPTARRFLSEQFSPNPPTLNNLQGKDIADFMLRQSKITSPRQMQLVGTALRVFLRFLRFSGEIDSDLAGAVPTVSNRDCAELPKFISPEQVKLLLNSCDRERAVGRRDYAILLLMARLGLRASEIMTLTLEDLDWESGLITIHGKRERLDRLPLPYDVGEALADYLQHGRPPCSTRRLFVRAKAPFRGLARNGCVCAVVRYACRRAGISPPHQGAHLLRHSLATNMLQKGATMREIGEILRHRLPNTTEIYAKVDIEALREVAQPWIGEKNE